jgi:hypothetical protein
MTRAEKGRGDRNMVLGIVGQRTKEGDKRQVIKDRGKKRGI